MKSQRKQVFLLLTALIVAVTVTNISLRGQNQKTPSAEGRITEQHKEHSKLYKDYRFGKKLREVAAETEGTEVAVIRGMREKTFNPDSPPFDLHSFLRNLACDADAVVIGVIKNQSSQLTEDEDFVFTDYDMSVEQILKDNAKAPIQLTNDLTISRPGGIVQLDNKIVRAIDESLDPLSIGHQYILFLTYIPTTGAYKAFDSNGSFQLSNKRIVKLTKESLPSKLETGNDAESLSSEIRNVSAIPCYK